jgi:hypothetical protein
MRDVVGCVAAVLAAVDVRGQEPALAVTLRDGSVVAAASIAGDPGTGVELVSAGGRRRVSPADLLAVQVSGVQIPDLPAVHLAGGDIVRGALAGGDAAGEAVDVLSPVFGRVRLRVERLAAFVVAGQNEDAARLRLPEGVGEGVFQRAAFGHDLLAGVLHQFGDGGVRFQPDGEPAPRWIRLPDLVAVRIAEAEPHVQAPAAQLLTRAGDRVGVTVRRFEADGLRCELEDGSIATVRLADVACLLFGAGVTSLSDLEPIEATESAFDGPVVHPWRRDRACDGGSLLVAGRAYAKGLGVHSRSRLVFTAPPGSERFWSRVGVDDGASALAPRADADVRVLVNERIRFEKKGLAPGQPPFDTGLLPVQPGDRIALEVDFGRGRDLADRVDWLLPVFLSTPGRGP